MNVLYALLLSDNDHALGTTEALLDHYGFQSQICRSSARAEEILKTQKFDLAMLDFDLPFASQLLEMKITNGSGYRSIIVALASDYGVLSRPLAEQVHFALAKPFLTARMDEILKSAYRCIVIEKRSSFRYAVRLSVSANYFEGDVVQILKDAELLDISRSGICLKANSVIPKNARITVEFQLPGTTAVIHTVGIVMWSDSHGRAGINIRFVPPQEFKILRDWLNDRCPWNSELALPQSSCTASGIDNHRRF